MTAKEKAIELIETFNSPDAAVWVAKEHALKAVELRLDGYFMFTAIEYGEDSMEYWQEVKSEIEKL
jgi:phosphopantetheinyl transferase (holo-ACP synthase)